MLRIVAGAGDPPLELSEVFSWFITRGFGVALTPDGAEWWAHLFPLASLEITVPRYGRGSTVDAALQRARDRYRVEEEGLK
jgi:hypothetical protein